MLSGALRRVASAVRGLVDLWLDRNALPMSIKIAFLLAIVAFVGAAFAFALSQGPARVPDVDPVSVFVAVLLLIGSLSINAFAWSRISRQLHYGDSLFSAVMGYFVSNLARYIPGSFWYLVVRVRLAGPNRRIRSVAAVGVLYEIILAVTASALVALALGGHFLRNYPLVSFIPIGVAALVCLLFLHPAFFRMLSLQVLNALSPESPKVSLQYLEVLVLLGLYVAAVLLMGLSFFFVVRALSEISATHLLGIVGLFSLAWFIGFLVPFAPGGFGIREGVLIFVLATTVSPVAAAIAPVGHRILLLTIEIILAAVFWAVSIGFKRPHQSA